MLVVLTALKLNSKKKSNKRYLISTKVYLKEKKLLNVINLFKLSESKTIFSQHPLSFTSSFFEKRKDKLPCLFLDNNF